MQPQQPGMPQPGMQPPPPGAMVPSGAISKEITHGPSFAMLRIDLASGQTIVAEARAMVAKHKTVNMEAKLNAPGGSAFAMIQALFVALVRKFSPTAADLARFSLEAGVAMSALNKAGRERLIRYCLRGPLALERLSRLRDGSIAYRTKYGRGQRTHLVMTPVEFLAHLASLEPPPRIPLVRYFGGARSEQSVSGSCRTENPATRRHARA